MKLIGLEINNVMRLESAYIEFPGSGAITIGGKNRSGKTSMQTLLEMMFGGQAKCPQLPVRVGAEKGWGRLTLDNDGTEVVIDLEVKEDRTMKVTVRQDGGKAIKSPVTMLKKMVSKFTFDPFALMALRGREQRQVMLDCLGVDFDDLDEKIADIKDERQILGRDVNGRERQLEQMEVHKDVPSEEIRNDVSGKCGWNTGL